MDLSATHPGHRASRSRARRPAVTLLEIVLAVGLMVVLSSMTFWFYSASLETRERGTREAQKLRLVRVVLDRMREEIRQASLISAPDRVGIRGEGERIWLSTLRAPDKDVVREFRYDEDALIAQTDLTKVEYKIARHPEILDEDGFEEALGLARVELVGARLNSAETGEAFEDRRATSDSRRISSPLTDDALRNQAEQEAALADEGDRAGSVGAGPDVAWEELYAPEIRFLRFCYFDGHTWWDKWDVTGENPLPQLVAVTIGFDGLPPLGEEFGRSENSEFCTCLNEDPVECEPLGLDRFSMVVRVPQSDPLFRSRITRETQAFVEEISGGQEEEEQQP